MSGFTGTARLARLAIRRDRVQLPVWVVGLVVTEVLTAASVAGLYPEAQDRVDLATGSATVATISAAWPCQTVSGTRPAR